MSDNEQQKEATQKGFIALHSNYYFTCSSGLAPAKICPTQNNLKAEKKYPYLIHHDKATQNIGDFFAVGQVVLAAAVAAAGVALVALAAVSAVASGTMCGGLMAPMREWVGYSKLNTYGGKTITLSNKPKQDLVIG